jgi:hypothetical protein
MGTKVNATWATAEVFWTAFRALPKAEREIVVRRLVAGKEFRENLLDLAVFEDRQGEAVRSYRAYLRDRRHKKPRGNTLSGFGGLQSES